MREIVFDTETTGLDYLTGDRLIEVGCVELLNHIPTGRTFHAYVNPRRAVSLDAVRVHGLTDEFLSRHPCFELIAEALTEFIADSPLVAHNAAFDRAFINMEFGLCGHPQIPEHRFVDTLQLARRRHPNGPNSLDALCARYAIDNSARVTHGALLDAEILASVYLELLGGRQSSLVFSAEVDVLTAELEHRRIRPRPRPLAARLNGGDVEAHERFVAGFGAPPIWARYRPDQSAAA
jgi:DNA polymerase-3 subunit epsilon